MNASLRTTAIVIDAIGSRDPAVVDCALSATEAACLSLNDPWLLDWDEYRSVAL